MPLVFAFAAGLEDLPVEEFLASPTKLSNGLQTVFGFFQVDGITCWCDDTAVAATLGCSVDRSEYPPVVAPQGLEGADAERADAEQADVAGAERSEAEQPEVADVDSRLDRIGTEGPSAVAVDVVRRLGSLEPESVLLGTIPGPVTLAGQLTGLDSEALADRPELLKSAAKACLALGRAFGEAGLDVLLVRESELLQPGGALEAPDIARLYAPLWNTARFYGMVALLAPARQEDLVPGAVMADSVATLRGAVDGLVVPAESVRSVEPMKGAFRHLGAAVPTGTLTENEAAVEGVLEESGVLDMVADGRLFLVTTASEVAPDADRETLIRGITTAHQRVRRAIERGK